MPFSLTVNNYQISFILWNLFLLSIPFFLAVLFHEVLEKRKLKKLKNKFFAFALAFLWLLFIPNAAYVIADLRHISGFCGDSYHFHNCIENIWMVPFFFTYGAVGWVAFVMLINQMREIVERHLGDIYGAWFAPVMIPIINLGVFLGLVGRWNSWDIFISPQSIIADAWQYLVNPLGFRSWLAYTIFLYILYYFGTHVFTKKKFSLKIKLKQ
jgi:uncharacterized membrane protein